MNTSTQQLFKEAYKGKTALEAIIVTVLGIALVVALVLLSATLIQWSWALVMPSIFGLPYLTLKEALGLVLLKILFVGKNK